MTALQRFRAAMQPTLGEQRTPDLPRCARLRSRHVPSGIQQPSRRVLRENLTPSAVVESYDEQLREPRQPASLEMPTAIPQAGDQFLQPVRAEGLCAEDDVNTILDQHEEDP
jgi:hypothetical protein